MLNFSTDFEIVSSSICISGSSISVIFSLSFIFVMFVVFLVLNSALKKENLYTPSMKENNTTFIQNFDGLTLKSEKKVYLYEIINDKKIYVINIWASWCVPCRVEHNFLIKLKGHNTNDFCKIVKHQY